MTKEIQQEKISQGRPLVRALGTLKGKITGSWPSPAWPLYAANRGLWFLSHLQYDGM